MVYEEHFLMSVKIVYYCLDDNFFLNLTRFFLKYLPQGETKKVVFLDTLNLFVAINNISHAVSYLY